LSIPSFYTEKVGHSKSGHFSMYYSTTIKNWKKVSENLNFFKRQS
jgi:hypothetical protein